jgi:hypothetical protein
MFLRRGEAIWVLSCEEITDHVDGDNIRERGGDALCHVSEEEGT